MHNHIVLDIKNISNYIKVKCKIFLAWPIRTSDNNFKFEVIECIDTKDKERIHVYHKSGTFVEIHPNGDVVTQHKNGWRSATGNDKLHVYGNMDIVVDGNVTWTVGGNVTKKITGNLDIDAKRIDLN